MLVLVFAILTTGDLLCAVPCGAHTAAPAEPSSTSHCQAVSSESAATTMSPAAECDGEHGRLAPAEVSPRRGTTAATIVTDLPRALRPDLQSAALVAPPARRLDAAISTLAPPLRI